jgi:hypothetical protein
MDGDHNHARLQIYVLGFFHPTVQVIGLTSLPGEKMNSNKFLTGRGRERLTLEEQTLLEDSSSNVQVVKTRKTLVRRGGARLFEHPGGRRFCLPLRRRSPRAAADA